MEIRGNIVDIEKKKIIKGKIVIVGEKIKEIIPQKEVPDRFILPGFIDAHVHIESSMLTPVEFGRLAVRHGTVGVVTDPHEIANVLGIKGIRFMMHEAGKAPVKIKFGVPSCVPATAFETSGAIIKAKDIEELFKKSKELHLSEMMNYPGIIKGDKVVMEKINVARKFNRVIDGHAPGLSGEDLKKYVKAGISTDHECSTFREAEEKILLGMFILIREGSAAKNYEALFPLIEKYPEKVMFCTDDSHPDDLAVQHIRNLVLRSIAKGLNFWKVMQAAVKNAVKFYDLPVGLLQEGDAADFIVCDNLKEMNIQSVYMDGVEVYDGESVKKVVRKSEAINKFECQPVKTDNLVVNALQNRNRKIRVIGAEDGSLLTKQLVMTPQVEEGKVIADLKNDIIKIVVVNRYIEKVPVIAFIHGFGMRTGALASSIAHDSHNLIAVGTTDNEIAQALNAVIKARGGIAVVNNDNVDILPLPVAGLMSNEDGMVVAKKYKVLNEKACQTGTLLHAPFMTLSFMALLVIPELKISDLGLFDVNKFDFVSLFT